MRVKATPPAPERSAVVLSGMFAITGATHFLRPAVFDPIVPRRLPGSSRSWTYASGVAELVLSVLVASARTRNLGGFVSVLFLIAVFPANLRTVKILRTRAVPARLTALARLPLQVPLVALALRVGRGEGASR